MADSKLNQFLAFETSAARTARTPSPPSPASGPAEGYWSIEQDGSGNPTGNVYTWSVGGSAWVKVTGGGSGPTQGLINTLLAEDPSDEQWPVMSVLAPAASNGSGGGGSFPAYTGTTAPPALAAFTWVNQNGGASATAIQTGGTGTPILMTIPNPGSIQWKGLFATAPATPYTRTAWLQNLNGDVDAADFGLYFYDGTKLMGIEFLTLRIGGGTEPLLRVEKITNVNTDNSTVASFPAFFWRSGPIGFRVKNDGTNLTFYWSFDGYNWVQLYTEAVGAFITPTQVGWGGLVDRTNGQAAGPEYVNLQSWGN